MTVETLDTSKNKRESTGMRVHQFTKEHAHELGVSIVPSKSGGFGRLVETKPGGLEALRKHRENMDSEERKHKVVSIKEHENPYWDKK